MKKWIITTLGHYWHMIALLLGLQIGYALLVALQPKYFQLIVSLVVRESGSNLLTKGLPVIALLATIYIAGSVIQGISGYLGCIFSARLLKNLQVEFFKKVSHLPIDFFKRQSTGEFFAKFNNDIGQSQNFIANIFPSALREAVTAMAVAGILFYFCPATLVMAALAIVLVTALLVVQLNRIMAKFAKAQRAEWSEINRLFDETVEGIDTLKAFATEQRRADRFQRHTAKFRRLSVRAGSVAAVFSPGIELVSKFGGLALIFGAYYMIFKGNINVDPFLLFFFYSGLLMASVSALVNHLRNLQFELVGLRNLASFFAENTEEEKPAIESERILRPLPISICDLRFGYPGGRLLFNDASLFIPANSITVIHGPSGSGKSTLINLLLRFYAPRKGAIRLGGIDIEKFSRKELRRQISVVTQYHFIFHESLRENLLVAKPDASPQEITRALERAHLKEFLQGLPNGIDEMMDPRGKGISAGERQRISIARLLLRNAPLMVLDEPWSNLDEEARNVLAEVINACKQTTTILVLTHYDLPLLAVDNFLRIVPEQGIILDELKDTGYRSEKETLSNARRLPNR